MEFSTSSWHYKLVNRVYTDNYFYNKTYAWDSVVHQTDFIIKTPKNISLCKYFWSVILACILYSVWIPIKFLIITPSKKLSKHFPKTKYDFNLPQLSENTKDNIGMGFLMGFIGLIVGLAIYGLITNFWNTLKIIIVVSVVLGFIIGIAYCMNLLADRVRVYRRRKELQDLQRRYIPEIKPKQDDTFWSMFKEYLKNKKEKVCPFLKFKD